MADNFDTSCEPNDSDQLVAAAAKLLELRQAEADLSSQISGQRGEIQRLKSMLREVLPTQSQATVAAPTTTRKKRDSWSRLVRIDSQRCGSGASLENQMSELFDEIEAGENELQRARHTVGRIIGRKTEQPAPVAPPVYPIVRVQVDPQTEQLQRRVTALESMVDGQEQLRSEIEQLREQGEEQNRKLTEERDHLLEKVQVAFESEQSTRSELAAAEGRIENQRQTIAAAEQSLVEAEAARTQVNKELHEAVERALGIQRDLEASRHSLTDLYERVEKESSTFSTENNRLRDSVRELSEQKHHCEERLAEQVSQLNAHAKTEASLRETLKDERAAAETIAAELKELQETHDQLLAECAEKAMRIEALINHSKRIDHAETKKSQALNAQTAELMKLNATHANLVKSSQQQTQIIDDLLSEKEELEQQQRIQSALLSKREQQLENLVSQLQQAKEASKADRAEIKALSSSEQQANDEVRRQADLLEARQSDLSKLQAVHFRIKRTNGQQAAQIQSLTTENETLGNHVGEKETELANQKSQLAKLRRLYEELELVSSDQAARIETLNIERQKFADEQAAKTKSLALHQQQLEELRTTHRELGQHSDQQAAQIQTLIDAQELSASVEQARAAELAQKQTELDELQNAHETMMVVSTDQAERIEQLIAEKELLITEQDQLMLEQQKLVAEKAKLIEEQEEASTLNYTNLQAAAEDIEALEVEKSELLQELAGRDSQTRQVIPMAEHLRERSLRAEVNDDLTRIEGIGPKIQQLLNEKGIRTYRKLASTPADRLKKILESVGGTFRTHDPTTWPEQAKLAATGEWEALVYLQDELNGGRRVA